VSDTYNTRVLAGVLLDTDTGDRQRYVTDIKGWDDAPENRFNLVDRAGQDGAYDSSGSVSVRVIEVAGMVKEADHASALATARDLTNIRPQLLHQFTCTNSEVGTLTAFVRITKSVKIEWIGDRLFTYTLAVTAPDPLKYGDRTFGRVTLDVEGSVGGIGLQYPLTYPLSYGVPGAGSTSALALENNGALPYWPNLRMDGMVRNPIVTLQETGATLKYNATLPNGQWLEWDLANRRVLLQGQLSMRTRVTATGNWLAVPPGGGSVSWSADEADSAAALSVWGYKEVYA
jgi:hypothetical protein